MVTRNKTTIVFFGENEILMNHEAFGISSTFHKPLKAYSFELPIKILELKKKGSNNNSNYPKKAQMTN